LITQSVSELPVGSELAPPEPATGDAGTAPPTSTAIVAEPAPAILTAPAGDDRSFTADERASQVLEQRTRDSQRWEATGEIGEALLKELPEHRRVVLREGKIRRALSIQAPSDYTLQHADTGLRLNYLYAPEEVFPLKELLGIKVRIKGEEGIDPRWPGTPVLLIRTLEVLP
jgi:hypothetical protein